MLDEPATTRTDTPVVFNGETGEYFRIWIVNMALTIVTLGIYSAWATVRKRRYFYTHTHVADGHFDFHASPVAILVGRLIAVGLIGAYFGSGYLHPLGPLVVLLAGALMFPWLIVRSRAFRMRTTSYRGLRFNFVIDYLEAFKIYYLSTLLIVITLGFGTGKALHMRNKFVVNHSGFGKTRFEFLGATDQFHSIYFRMLGLIFLTGVIMAVLTPLLVTAGATAGNENAYDASAALFVVEYVITGLFFLAYFAIGVYYRVRIRNYVWNSTVLGRNELVSSWSAREMIWLYISNIIAIIVTLGLATPWAQIRMARYQTSQTMVVLADDWQDYLASGETEGSAIGDEIGEAFDVDVGVGF